MSHTQRHTGIHVFALLVWWRWNSERDTKTGSPIAKQGLGAAPVVGRYPVVGGTQGLTPTPRDNCEGPWLCSVMCSEEVTVPVP